jgi:hypothetical protein
MSAATSGTSTVHDGAIPHIAALMPACFDCFGFTTELATMRRRARGLYRLRNYPADLRLRTLQGLVENPVRKQNLCRLTRVNGEHGDHQNGIAHEYLQ